MNYVRTGSVDESNSYLINSAIDLQLIMSSIVIYTNVSLGALS